MRSADARTLLGKRWGRASARFTNQFSHIPWHVAFVNRGALAIDFRRGQRTVVMTNSYLSRAVLACFEGEDAALRLRLRRRLLGREAVCQSRPGRTGGSAKKI